MLRKIPLIEDQYFHVFNKGVDSRDIFMSDRDYLRFWLGLYFFNDSSLRLVRLERIIDYYLNDPDKFRKLVSDSQQYRKPFVQLVTHCLMPNHFHLLLKALIKDGISKFLQRIEGSHANYFNKLYKRKGALFGGGFRAELVKSAEGFVNVACYNHTNPLSLFDPSWKEGAGIKDFQKAINFLKNYKWSSFNEYFNADKVDLDIVDKKDLLDYFRDNDLHYKFILDWIKRGNTDKFPKLDSWFT